MVAALMTAPYGRLLRRCPNGRCTNGNLWEPYGIDSPRSKRKDCPDCEGGWVEIETTVPCPNWTAVEGTGLRLDAHADACDLRCTDGSTVAPWAWPWPGDTVEVDGYPDPPEVLAIRDRGVYVYPKGHIAPAGLTRLIDDESQRPDVLRWRNQ